MASLRRHEGYLLSDNRLSGGALVELPIVTCSHCQRGVVMNPGRTREREYCPKCDHYLCDQCGLTRKLDGGECRNFNQLLDTMQEAAFKQLGKEGINQWQCDHSSVLLGRPQQ